MKWLWILLVALMLESCQLLSGGTGGSSETTAKKDTATLTLGYQGVTHYQRYVGQWSVDGYHMELADQGVTNDNKIQWIKEGAQDYWILLQDSLKARWLSLPSTENHRQVDTLAPRVRLPELPKECRGRNLILETPDPIAIDLHGNDLKVPVGIWKLRNPQNCASLQALNLRPYPGQSEWIRGAALLADSVAWPSLEASWQVQDTSWQVWQRRATTLRVRGTGTWSRADSSLHLDSNGYLQILHSMPPSGGGIYVNEYTVMMDFRMSTLSPLPLFNTDSSAYNQAEFSVDSLGRLGGADLGGWGSRALEKGKWYRLVLRANLVQGIFEWYINGVLQGSARVKPQLDGILSLYTQSPSPAFVLLGQVKGHSASVDLRRVALFSSALDPMKIAALGGYENAVPRDFPGDSL